ncbi:MAG: O-antigen ligase family protein [Candidatus Thorarchaeota archaeon]
MKFDLFSLLFIVATDYIGLGKYIGILKKLPLPLVLILSIYYVSKGRIKDLVKYKQAKILLFILIYTMASITFALLQKNAFDIFKAQFSYFLLFIVIFFALKDIRKIEIFLFSMIIIHLFLIVTNIGIITSGSRAGAFDAGYFLGDGNDMGWSLAIVLPFSIYFLKNKTKFSSKIIFTLITFIFISGLLGIASRGATLAVAASFLYMLKNSKKKLIICTVLVLSGILITIIAPKIFVDRMSGITEYKSDSSAMGRIIAWKAATLMAIDHPLGVGAGNFSPVYGRFYRERVVSENIWGSARWISAHSIYFLMLAEYGFLGATMLIYLIFLNIKENSSVIDKYQNQEQNRKENEKILILAKHLNMSMIAFAVGGAFLGGIHYPHLFILTALTIRMNEISNARKNEK